MLSVPPSGRSHLVAFVAGALLAYSLVAISIESRWASGVAGSVVAWLLWQRHPRARFAAYVFLSAVGLRAALAGGWTTFIFAIAVIALLQTPAARRAWPLLSWRWARRADRPGSDGKG